MSRLIAALTSLALGLAILGCGTGQEETGEPTPKPKLNRPTSQPPALDGDGGDAEPAPEPGSAGSPDAPESGQDG